MAKKSRMGVLKRQRELKKAEKAALKAERKRQRKETSGTNTGAPTQEDLEGYGMGPDSEEA